MTSLFDLARSDLEAILGTEATSSPITLTAPDTTAYSIRGHVYRVEEQVDPETGARMFNPATFVNFSAADAPMPDETWTASATLGGVTVTGSVVNVRHDRTIGLITFEIEVTGE